MTEGQRKTLHELLDRMIDDGMCYGIVEYANMEEIERFMEEPPIWPELYKIRMELTLKIRNEE
jgi:hypothetical protein